MKKVTLFNFFRRKLLNIIFIFSIVISIILTLIITQFYLKKEQDEEHIFYLILSRSLHSLSHKIENIESIYRTALYKILLNFSNFYSLNYNHSPEIEQIEMDKIKNIIINLSNYDNIKLEKSDINYYYINDNGIIYKSDYKEDIGLDIKIFKDFWPLLKKLPPNKPLITLMTVEYNTGINRIYGFIKLNDNNYFEIGIKFINILDILKKEIFKYSYENFKIEDVYISWKLDRLNKINKNSKIYISKEDRALFLKSKELNKIIRNRISLFKNNYYFYHTGNGEKFIKVTIYSKDFFYTLLSLIAIIILILLNYIHFFIIGKSISTSVSENIISLSNFMNILSTKRNLNNVKIKRNKNNKFSITEINNIYNNFEKLLDKISSNEIEINKEKEKITKLLIKSNENLILFRKLANSIPASIIIYKNNSIYYCNDFTEKMFKIKKEDFSSKSIIDFIHPQSIPVIRNIINNKNFNNNFNNNNNNNNNNSNNNDNKNKNINNNSNLSNDNNFSNNNIFNNNISKNNNFSNNSSFNNNFIANIIKIKNIENEVLWVKLIAQNIKIQDENALLLTFLDINEAKNKEIKLINSLIEIEKYQNDISRIINIINKMATKNTDNPIKFLIYIFRELFLLIKEANYGSIFINTGNYIKFIDTIGYNTKELQKLKIKSEWFFAAKNEVEILNNFFKEDENAKIDPEIKKQILKYSKKIKEALQITIESELGIYITFSLDIDAKSKNRFSQKSLIIAKLFKKLLEIYFYAKIGEDRLKTILYTISDGIIVTDNKNNIIVLNKEKIKNLFNFDSDEIKGKNFENLFENIKINKIIHKSSNTNSLKLKKEDILKLFFSKIPGTFELNINTKNNKEKTVEITKKLYYNSYKEFLGEIIVIKDLTKEKELNQQISQAQKLETIGKFTGGIAHDFNNILSSILGSSELIKMIFDKNKLSLPDKEELNEYINIISNSATKGKKFIRNLLDFSRTSTNSFEKINIHTLLTKAIEIIKKSINKKNKIITYFNAKDFFIVGDQIALENSFLNILLNASQAIKDKNGLIEIRSDNISKKQLLKIKNFSKFISNKKNLENNYIIISIKDNGQGIPEEIINKIFDPFFTTKEKGKGTGLGLSMVFQTIKSHNGFINVESKVNIGTKFDIILPVILIFNIQENFEKQKSKTTNDKNLEKKLKLLQNKNILIVDDEDDVRKVLKSILSKFKINVIEAKNGLEAINIYSEKNIFSNNKNEKIDVVILDLLMPVMDGKETFNEIKKLDPSAKILISSGYEVDINIFDLQNKDVNNILIKPYNINSLLNAIINILSFQTIK